MMMEDRMVRDLPEKSEINLEDKMVIEDIDGTKLAPISTIRDTIMNKLIFDNVEDMKSASIDCDSFCMTLGYRKAGDGGGAYYQIVYEPTAIDDGINYLYLHTSDVNRAKFIPTNGFITPEQLGAYGDGINDDSAIITKCLSSNYDTRFTCGKTYLINQSIEIPNKDNVYIDLNGCTLKTNSSVFGVFKAHTNISSPADNKYLTIKNGYIDMNKKGGSPIVLDRQFKKVLIDNIVFSNITSGNCIFKGIEDAVIDNCSFIYEYKNSGTGISAIECTFGQIPSQLFQNVCVKNTSFINCTGISMMDSTLKPHRIASVDIDNCCVMVNEEWRDSYFLVLERFSSNTADKPCCINISNIDATGIQSLISTTRCKCSISIRDVVLNYCKNLFNSSNVDATFTIEGHIYAASADGNDRSMYPLVPPGYGYIHLNTTSIDFGNNHREAEPSTVTAPNQSGGTLSFTGLNNYNYTIYDNTNMETYPVEKKSLDDRNGIVSIENFRNHVIQFYGTLEIGGIAKGLNNQIIGIQSDELQACNIRESTTVEINIESEHTSSQAYSLSGRRTGGTHPNTAYFKYSANDRKWKQI